MTKAPSASALGAFLLGVTVCDNSQTYGLPGGGAMLDYFRDPLWQAVGVVLGVLVAIAIYLLQRERKRLSFAVVTDLPLLTSKERGVSDLEVRYQGQALVDASLWIVKIINTGNRPILASDFEQAVSFFFDETTSIVAAEILKTEPRDLLMDVRIVENGHAVSFSKRLLNPKDSFECRMLIEGRGRPKVVARIAGVKAVSEVSERTGVLMVLSALMLIFSFASFFVAISMTGPLPEPDPPSGYAVIGLLAMLAAATLLLVVTLRTLVALRLGRRRRRRR